MPENKMPLPHSTKVEDVQVKIREIINHPNLRNLKQVILKDGPRTYRFASLWEVINPLTKAHHHYALRIDSVDHLRAGWHSKPDKSVSLDGKDGEIERLYTFLSAFFDGKLPDKSGDVHIIGAADYLKLEKLLEAIPQLASKDKIELLGAVLSKFDASPTYVADLAKTLAATSHEVLKNLSIASRYVEYQKAFQEFQILIDTSETKEAEFQSFLGKNPWFFGSEYSDLLDRRTWSRDQAVDFMFRRTIDGYLEVIEIKRATGVRILQYDDSHKCYYPSAALSQTIGQVCFYLETLESDRHRIKSVDGLDPARIKARIVMGRDGSEAEINALHSLNSRLHRIEIMTYDQLKNIGLRTLGFFEKQIPGQASPANSPQDELPF